jgi:DNA-binding GntR family transcriptional regulator
LDGFSQTYRDQTLKNNFPYSLQQQIEQAILEGKLLLGQRVTCGELAINYQVTEGEMLQVLSAQYRKGLVQKHGEDYEITGIVGQTMDSLFQHTSKAGMRPSSDVRAAVCVPCPELAATKINVPAGAPVYRLERTRIINDEVLANQVNYIPFEVCPGLEGDDLSQYSFQKLLEGKYHTVISRVDEVVYLAPGTGIPWLVAWLAGTGCRAFIFQPDSPTGRVGYDPYPLGPVPLCGKALAERCKTFAGIVDLTHV